VTALNRYHTLDALRFFAFLKVFLLHLPDSQQHPFYHFIKQGGGTGVALFFVLSGFLISDILIREKEKNGYITPLRFWVRRAFRIWPLYYLGISIAFAGLIVGGYLGISARTGYDPTPWTSLFFLENYRMILEGTHPNGVPLTVFWSLCVEEHFYLLWLFVFVFVPLRRLFIVFIFFIFSGILTRYLSATGFIPYSLNGNEIISALDYFACGGMVAIVKRNPIAHKLFSIPPFRMVILPISIGFMMFQHLFYANLGIFGVTVSAVVYALLIAAYACASDQWLSISNNSILGKLGVISYGLYVFHTPTIMFFTKLRERLGWDEGSASGLWLIGLGSLIITMLVSYVVYRWYEVWFLKVRARYFTAP
jgi:peptidoglycan/LPS O-acetylase OafA/YrhL